MLRIYFATVLAYAFILWTLIIIMSFTAVFQKRRWLNQEQVKKICNKPVKTFIASIQLSLIPILRLMYIISLIAVILGITNPSNEE